MAPDLLLPETHPALPPGSCLAWPVSATNAGSEIDPYGNFKFMFEVGHAAASVVESMSDGQKGKEL